jgi:hypothetical protein
VPLYLHHRYQLTAATKVVGGVDYRYKLRGDSQPLAEPLAADQQRRALEAILRTLEPEFLDLSDEVLDLLHPRPAGFRPHRELFDGQTAPVFDPLAAAATAADATIRGLLQPERAGRLIDHHRRDASLPDFAEILDRLRSAVFDPAVEDPRHAAIRDRVESVLVSALIDLAGDSAATPETRAQAEQALLEVRDRASDYLSRSIDRFFARVEESGQRPAGAAPMPPGQPIGASTGIGGWSECSW